MILKALNYDGPGMRDHWRGVLGNEPFSLSQAEIGQLTNREMWVWYLKIGLQRSLKLRELQATPQATSSSGDVFTPETPEEIEQAVNMLKAMFGGRAAPPQP